MQISNFEFASGFAADGVILARFSIQVTPDLRLCGLKLIDTPRGRKTYFPSVSGGGRSGSASPAFVSRITATASKYYEGQISAKFDKTAA